MRIRLLLCGLLALILGAFAAAATQDPDSHELAAQRLLEITNTRQLILEMLDGAVTQQIEATPELAAYEDIMRGFLHKYFSWEALKEDLVAIYADSFSEPELRDLIEFYATPTGQKAIRVMPRIFRKSNAIATRMLTAHQAELVQAIEERREEMEGAPGPPSGPAKRPEPAGAGITMVLFDGEVKSISSKELIVQSKDEEERFQIGDDTSFKDSDDFPVDDRLRDDKGDWDEEKLREFLPPGSKVDLHYVVREGRQFATQVTKKE